MDRKAIFVAVLLPLVGSAVWAEGKVDTRNEPRVEPRVDANAGLKTDESVDVSYAFGMALGHDIKETGLTIDYGHFMEGLQAAMEDVGAKLTLDEAIELIQAAFYEMREAKMAETLEEGRQFLAENANRAGMQVTESGLQYVVVQDGNGEKPTETDVVLVHYEGRLIDGTVFDSSLERGAPVEFPLDAVISGWAEGLLLMTVGSRYTLYVPSELGYGEWGAGDVIPPNSVLVFDVELLGIVRDDESLPEADPDAEVGAEAEADAVPEVGAEAATMPVVPGSVVTEALVETETGAETAVEAEIEVDASAERDEDAVVPTPEEK
jgi:FKBP-type peptidyl-prolyl cis-trans isomerase FkpA